MNPLITADLDAKLKSLGFVASERKALCKIIQWKPPAADYTRSAETR